MKNTNSFDLLRLVAAVLVVISHQFALLGKAEPHVFGNTTLGFFGVIIFFVLSGWLISQSWVRDPEPRRFLLKRCLRIFPALLVIVLFTVLVIGPITTSLSFSEYLKEPLTWNYLRTALLNVQHYLPGVFENLPYRGVVNGSLWTLPIEFVMYLTVLGAGIIGLFDKKYLAATLLPLAGLVVFFIAKDNYVLTLGAECAYVFWFGVNFGFWTKSDQKQRTIQYCFTLMSLVILLLQKESFLFSVNIFVAFGLIVAANEFSICANLVKKFGDCSYGIYIYSFLLQQTLLTYLLKYQFSFEIYLGISLFFILIFSWISWHLIEKKALKFKPKRAMRPV